jgi:hypothetical protein
MIADRGQMAWQKASGYNLRAKVEASIGRYKRVMSALTETDPLSLMEVDPADARELVIGLAA